MLYNAVYVSFPKTELFKNGIETTYAAYTNFDI